jgi:hypothetical protein
LPPPPDGRTRRSKVPDKNRKPTFAQRMGDEVKALADQGMLIQDLAKHFQVDRGIIRKTLVDWHRAHGLDWADGRNRRWQCPGPRRWKDTDERKRSTPPDSPA